LEGCQYHQGKIFSVVIARFFIWSFFILIVDQTLVITGFKFGLPVKPAYVYAFIATGLLFSALSEHITARLSDAKWFFIPFLAIVLLGALMYHGENPGPDFGVMVLRPRYIPTSIGYVIWPALNLIAGAGLFLLASRTEFRNTIVIAAFAALILQVATMEADMWWPAVFGDHNGRAGGLAQNANIAALLVVVLACLTLSSRYAPYAVPLALAGVLLSQSKAGVIGGFVLAAAFLIGKHKMVDRRSLAFAGAIVLMLTGTLYFSPVLNPSPEMLALMSSKRETRTSDQMPVATLDRPVTLEERLAARTSMDESAGLRWEAAKFFLGIAREHPFGIGTGFSNKFATGPHNSFLKLAVDNGVFGFLLLFALLAAVAWKAMKSRSPQIISLALIAWLTALAYHTFMVDPIVLPALAIALGSIEFRCFRIHPLRY
jgi:hypothetical protein